MIEVKNVTKSFKKTSVLKEINLTFESGHIYGLIGKNGSGKTVLLKILCGFYNPTSGEVLFDGENIFKENKFPPNTRALIEKPYFLPDLSGYDNLKLLASLNKKTTEEDIYSALKLTNLYDHRNQKYNTYSLGMKQKLGIAQVLMDNPDIIILDEPFNGIEEQTAKELREDLLKRAKKGKVVIIATHLKEDIEGLVDKTYIFEDGKVISEINDGINRGLKDENKED